MSADAPWQVLSDCPHCRTEAAVVELLDPSHPATRFGVPSERRCRMCGWHQVALPIAGAPAEGCPRCRAALPEEAASCPACGFVPELATRTEPRDLRDGASAMAALRAWAEEEGELELDVFCNGSFGGPPEEIAGKLARGEVIPTMFDVIAFLFPSAGGGSAPAQRVVEQPAGTGGVSEEVRAVPARAPEPASEPAPDPRTPARMLVSVMVADGALRAGERKFVAAFLEREGLAPMASDDLRVWRPSELGPPPALELRDKLLEAAVHLMHVDRERDGSEWRVIQTFARAWGVPEARLQEWDQRYDRRYSTAMTRLGRLLNRLLG